MGPLILKRAILTVSDKTGLVEFGMFLHKNGVELVSTGGTHKLLTESGIPAKKVEEVTGFPEMLDGRVKSMHPRIHAGVLAKRTEEHLRQLKEHDIQQIDMVVVNLYPFESTISRQHTLEEAIENIDIGGPSLIRAAAKNYQSVAVVVNPARYKDIMDEMEASGGISQKSLETLSVEAFEHTAYYDSLIYDYLYRRFSDKLFPPSLVFRFKKVSDLRYGENPYQKAAFYREGKIDEASAANVTKIQGKDMSFSNILDIDAALEIIKDFEEPTAVIIKHTNPCGLASAPEISRAFADALDADRLSAYGGITVVNREVDVPTAEKMREMFLDIIIAPSYQKDALSIVKKKKAMLLTYPQMSTEKKGFDMKRVAGGLLLQERPTRKLNQSELKVVTKRAPTEEELDSLMWGWRVVRHVKSNGIVFVKGTRTVGVGAGQMSRVMAVRIAIEKAGENAKGAVMASDAFFPFPDGIDAAGKAGITAVMHPGGSIRDSDAIAKADEYDMAMVLTGFRVFRH